MKYRRLTRFGPPLTRFGPPIISLISELFLGIEIYVAFWYINFQLTAENSHYLVWLKTLCSWAKARQRWAKRRPMTVMKKVDFLSNGFRGKTRRSTRWAKPSNMFPFGPESPFKKLEHLRSTIYIS